MESGLGIKVWVSAIPVGVGRKSMMIWKSVFIKGITSVLKGRWFLCVLLDWSLSSSSYSGLSEYMRKKRRENFFTASTKDYKHNSKCKLPDAIWEEQLKLLILWQKLPNFLNDQFTFFFSNGPAKEQGNLFENACKGGMRGFLLLLEVYRPPGVYMRVTGLESCAGGQM